MHTRTRNQTDLFRKDECILYEVFDGRGCTAMVEGIGYSEVLMCGMMDNTRG